MPKWTVEIVFRRDRSMRIDKTLTKYLEFGKEVMDQAKDSKEKHAGVIVRVL